MLAAVESMRRSEEQHRRAELKTAHQGSGARRRTGTRRSRLTRNCRKSNAQHEGARVTGSDAHSRERAVVYNIWILLRQE